MSQPPVVDTLPIASQPHPIYNWSNWWRQIPALLLILVELLWIVPWIMTVLLPQVHPGLGKLFLVFGSVMLTSYIFAWIANTFRLLGGIRHGLLDGFLVLSLILVVRTLLRGSGSSFFDGLLNLDPFVIMITFCILWLWWRGVTLARSSIRPLEAWRRFELSLLMLLVNAFYTVEVGLPSPGLGWFLLLLLAGFSAVIFTRISYAHAREPGSKNPYQRRWMAPTFLILGSMLLAAAFLGSLLLGQYSMLFDWIATTIRVLISLGLFLLLMPLLIILVLILYLLEKFGIEISLKIPDLLKLEQMPQLPSPTPAVQEAAPTGLAALPQMLPAIFFWAAVAILVVFLFSKVRQLSHPDEDALERQTDPLLKSGEAKRLLKDSLQNSLKDLVGRLRSSQRQKAAARIRQIYSELEEFCMEMNLSRPVGATPLEYIRIMRRLYVNNEDELWVIVQAYMRVRYGELPETRAEVEQVETAWKSLLLEGQRLKKIGLENLGLKSSQKDPERATQVAHLGAPKV